MATIPASSSSPPVFSSFLSRGFASSKASVADDDASYENQPGFEDEEVTVNTWLQVKLE